MGRGSPQSPRGWRSTQVPGPCCLPGWWQGQCPPWCCRLGAVAAPPQPLPALWSWLCCAGGGVGAPHPLPSPTSWGAAGTGSSPGPSASAPVLGQEPSPPLPCLAAPQAPEPPLPCLAAPQVPEPVPLDTSVVEQSLMLAGQCLGPPRTARARGWARGSSALLCPGSAGSFAPGGLLWVCTLVLLTGCGSAWHRAVSRLLSHVMG